MGGFPLSCLLTQSNPTSIQQASPLVSPSNSHTHLPQPFPVPPMYATVSKLETPLVPRLSPPQQPLLPPRHHSLHVSLTLALVTLIRVHKSGLKRPCLVSSCPWGQSPLYAGGRRVTPPCTAGDLTSPVVQRPPRPGNPV